MRAKCVSCGRFGSGLEATTRWIEHVYVTGPVLDKVTAVCVKHGRVDVEPGYEWLGGWSWEDFFEDDWA